MQSTLPRAAVRPRRLTPSAAVLHGLRVFAPGTAPRRKAHSGTERAAGLRRELPPARAGRPASARPPSSAPPRTRARSASRVSPTSPTRSPPPPSSPTCTSTPTPSSRRSCTTSSRTPRRPRISSRRASAPTSPSSSTASPSSTRSSSRAARRRRRSRFRKMLLAMVRDLRVILVKLADRTHNMRTIEAMAPARRRAIARETLEIYAPIAERLGLYNMKLELEDLGFKALYPRRYRVLERALKRARGNQKEFLKKIEQQLNAALLEERHPGARRDAREAPLQHLQQDAPQARASLNEIVDVYGLRIIVDKPDTCYRALGVVHCGVQADAGPLQGLHRDPARQRLPVAAHDAVRSERRADRSADPHRGHASRRRGRHRRALEVQERRATRTRCSRQRTREWLSNLVELQEDGTSEEFLESVKVDLFPDKVYVFTPKGDDPAPAERRDRGRLRLRGAHRHRQSLRRREGRPPPDAAAHRAAQRPDGRDHHRQGRDAQPVVGELRRHREGAQRHPPLPEEPAPHRGHRARAAAAQPGAGGVPAVARRCEPGRRSAPRSASSA